MFQKSIFIFVLSTIIHLTYGFSFGIGIKETKCFYDYIEEGSMLEGYYKTTPPDTQGRRIQLTVIGPDGNNIIKSLKPSQTFSFTAFKEGSHHFCFSDIVTSTKVNNKGDRVVNIQYSIEHPHVHATVEDETIDDLSMSLRTIESQMMILAEDYLNRKSHMDVLKVDLAKLNNILSVFSILSIGCTSILGLYQLRRTIDHLRKIKVIV